MLNPPGLSGEPIFNAKLKDHERKLLVPDGKNFIVVK